MLFKVRSVHMLSLELVTNENEISAEFNSQSDSVDGHTTGVLLVWFYFFFLQFKLLDSA